MTNNTQSFPPFFWVKYGSSRAVKVYTDGCKDVDDFIEKVKAKMSPDFDPVSTSRINIYTNDPIRNDALRPGLLLTDVASQTGFVQNDDQHPLRVAVDGVLHVSDEVVVEVAKRVKRLIDDEGTSQSSKSRKSSTSSRDSYKQSRFREYLMSRDTRCVLTGAQSDSCQACHIISWKYPERDLASWIANYRPFCLRPDDDAFDVRNGILMRASFNMAFDSFLFTIVFENDEYVVRVQDPSVFLSVTSELQFLDDKRISFPSSKRSEWPAPEFLKYHNTQFHLQKLKGAAEPKDMKRDNSGNTVMNDDTFSPEVQDKMWAEAEYSQTFINL
ncbi:hypothetical protein BDR26DRAFT_868608 [Obelidium mucronatum]|nr:hypothetical protein BDR26DRAFT_868608 [Obelidium mucronatum]